MVDSLQVVDSTKCMLSIYGYKYLIFVCTDLTISNILEIGIPYLKMKFQQQQNKEKQDVDLRPEFQIEEEYLELIFRQYIIYNAMIYFPMVTLFNVVISYVEIYVDKFRLVEMCKSPSKNTSASIRPYQYMLMQSMLFIALAAVFSHGAGVLVRAPANCRLW